MKDRVRVVKKDDIDKDFTRITKRITSTVVENIYKGVEIPDDIFDILHELKTMDALDKLDVFDEKLRALLVKEAGAFESYGRIRGRTRNDKKLETFKKKMTKYLRA
jgi:hypothetical protein